MTQQKIKYKVLDIFQFLCIDIVFGSLVTGYFIVKLLNITPNPMWWIILPISVWVIYSTDHILDSFTTRGKGTIVRHNYYYTNRYQLIPITVLSAVIVFILSLLYLDTRIVVGGCILLLFVVAYFGAINMFGTKIRNHTPKEIIIAIIYTTGVFMAPLIWFNDLPSYHTIFIMLVVLLLVWSEGIMISWYEYDNDILDGHRSFSIVYGKESTRSFLIGLHVIIETSILILLFSTETSNITFALIIILIMNITLGLGIMFPDNYIIKKHYRLIGEGVFVLPVLSAFM